MLHHLLSLQFIVSVIILLSVGLGATQSKMSTKQILSLVALVALGLVVVFQSYSAFSRNRSRFEAGSQKSCDVCCATLVFIAVSLLAIGNLTNEEPYKHGYPNWCIGVCEQQGQGSKGSYPREKSSGGAAKQLAGNLRKLCEPGKCPEGCYCPSGSDEGCKETDGGGECQSGPGPSSSGCCCVDPSQRECTGVGGYTGECSGDPKMCRDGDMWCLEKRDRETPCGGSSAGLAQDMNRGCSYGTRACN